MCNLYIPKSINYVVLQQNTSKLYPKLYIRILLYMRKRYIKDKIVSPEVLMKSFKKSSSLISQNTTILLKGKLISRVFVGNSRKDGSRVQFAITNQGLIVANRILFEGLTKTEKKTINALNFKFS